MSAFQKQLVDETQTMLARPKCAKVEHFCLRVSTADYMYLEYDELTS